MGILDWLFGRRPTEESKPVQSKPAVDGPFPVQPVQGLPPGHKWGPARTKGEHILMPTPDSRLLGFDFSHWQPRINWPRLLLEKPQFLFLKASDGDGKKDAMFDAHRAAATKALLPLGAYHFARFGGLSAKDEAALFLKYTGGVFSGELPLVVDIEWDKTNPKYGEGQTLDDAGAQEVFEIALRLEEATKITPIVYCSWPFFKNFRNPERFFRFHPWLPAYGVTGGPGIPLPWSRWAFWQWTNKHGLARAITGDPDLDANYFNGTKDELQALRKK